MKRDCKFKSFIKNPGRWLIAFYGGLLLTACAMVTVAVLCNLANPVIYVLSVILSALFIYCLIFTIKYSRARISRSLRSHKFTSRLADDYAFRTMVFSCISFAINVAYVLFQTIMAIIYRSMWYGTFAVYYAVLCLVRGVAVWADIRAQKRFGGDSKAMRKAKLHTYMWCGMLLILLSAALTVALSYMISHDISFRYAGLTIYVMIAYAFCKITISIFNLVRAKRFNDYGVQSLRNIGLTDALVSIFAIQTALIAAFGSGDDGLMYIMNAVMAVVVCLLTLGLGVYMIARSAVVLKRGEIGDEADADNCNE